MKPIKLLLAIAAMGLLTLTSHAQSWLTNGLAAYYPFNGNANDASGNGNDGTIYGGVLLTPDRFGSPDCAYVFNGVDGYINVGNPVGNSPVYLTESAWVKIISRANTPSDLPPVDVLITKRQTPYIGSGWPTLGIASSGQNIGAGEIIVDADNYIDPDFGTSQTPTNEWFFICGIKSNNTYQIYINGSLENTITDSYPLSSSEDMYLMHEGAWDTYCNGVLDDVRIYNRALSSNEVACLYSIESSPTATAVAAAAGGLVVGVTVTYGGSGYLNAPQVRFIGGGGCGAKAEAVVSNGVVTAVNVSYAGSGYTKSPLVVIDPPFMPNRHHQRWHWLYQHDAGD